MHYIDWLYHVQENGVLTEMATNPKYASIQTRHHQILWMLASRVIPNELQRIHKIPFDAIYCSSYWNNEHLAENSEAEICGYRQELLMVASED